MRIGRWSLVVVVTLGCLGSLACGRDDGEARNQVQSLSATDGGPRFSYYGGHLLANVEVVQVVWGPPIAGRQGYVPGVEGTVYPNMATFYQAAVTSSYLDWIGEEYGVPSQPIGRGSFRGRYAITPSVGGRADYEDGAIRLELDHQIAIGALPAPSLDANGRSKTYYALFFPDGVLVHFDGYRRVACRDFVGYHSSFVSAQHGVVLYGVHPDLQNCSVGAPSAFGDATAVASHELMEVMTNPEGSLLTSIPAIPGPPIGWVGSSYEEIGDVCDGQLSSFQGPGVGTSPPVTYVVEKAFSNRANECTGCVDAHACDGKCGSLVDVCGVPRICGGICEAPTTCGGGGTANVCGVSPACESRDGAPCTKKGPAGLCYNGTPESGACFCNGRTLTCQ